MKKGFVDVVAVAVVDIVFAVVVVVEASRFFPFFKNRGCNRKEARTSLSQKQETEINPETRYRYGLQGSKKKYTKPDKNERT